MADKRMFSPKVTESDAFLEMPNSSQILYVHLSMNADDDGFVDKPKSIMRMTNASEDDLKILLAKKFILPFESGVVVIKHWRINNYLRADRYTPTVYRKERSLLFIKPNGAYTFTAENGITFEELKQKRYTNGIPMVDQVVDADKIRLDKIRLDKIRLDKINKEVIENKSVREEDTSIPPLLNTEKIFNENCVEKTVRPFLDALIEKCNQMQKPLSEDELINYIVQLDFKFKKDDNAKIKEIRNAIKQYDEAS